MSSDNRSRDAQSGSCSARVLTREEADFLTEYQLGSEHLVVVGNEASCLQEDKAPKDPSDDRGDHPLKPAC